MQYLFDASVYQKRRSALAKSIGSGFIWIAGNADSPINYAANYYPFRQDSNFLYYGGLNLPHLNLVIDCVSGETTLYGDDLTIEDVVWTGPKPSLRELADKVGIEHVSPANAISGAIHGKDVHGLPCYRMEHFNLEKQIASSMELPSMDLVRAVISQREIKEDVEIAQMEQALAITAQMHTRAMTTVAEGMTESVLAGVAEGVAIANGCRLAYGAIVTRNGHILHNHDHHNVLANGDLVLCDMGSENRMLYAADITRTFPVSKTFTDRQKAIYNIVLEAETRCIEACTAGTLYRDVHMLAATIITEGLIEIGLMTGDPKEAVKAGAHALFFPHGLGHLIGLDVHDMEGLGEDHVGYTDEVKRSEQFGTAYLRLGKALAEGHVITVEPGIYFIPTLIDKWKAEGTNAAFVNFDKVNEYRDFGGVRIEDNVLVTNSGPQILGPHIAKTIEEIEALRS